MNLKERMSKPELGLTITELASRMRNFAEIPYNYYSTQEAIDDLIAIYTHHKK